MASDPTLVLESLYVKVLADYKPLQRASEQINAITNEIQANFVALASFAEQQMEQFTAALEATIEAAEVAITTGLDAIEGALTGFVGMVANLSTGFDRFVGSLVGVGNYFQGLVANAEELGLALDSVVYNLDRIIVPADFVVASVGNIQRIYAQLSIDSQALATNLDRFTSSLSGIGTYFNTLEVGLSMLAQAFAGLLPSFDAVISAFGSLGIALAGIAGLDIDLMANALYNINLVMTGSFAADIADVALAFTSLGVAIAGVNSSTLTSLVSALQGLEKLNLAAVTASIDILATAIVTLSTSMARINPARIAAFTASMQALANSLATVVVPVATTNLANLLTQIANATKTLGTISLPPIPPAMQSVAQAARNAQPPIQAITGRINDMSVGARQASGSLSMLRMSLGFFAGYGVFAFAKFDDALTRMTAHLSYLKEFGGLESLRVQQPIVGDTLLRFSLDTTSSVTNLTKALEVLQHSGMNAAAGMEALTVMENFAVASGTKVEESTKRMTGVLNGLGLATNDVGQRMQDLTRLSDLLVGTARQVNTTEEQLLEALGPRMTAMMRQTKMSMEEGIAVLAAFSRQGVQGAQAGDLAARTLSQIQVKGIENFRRWEEVGIRVFDNVTKEIKPVTEILKDMDKFLGGLPEKQKMGGLLGLGFEQRTIQNVIELLGNANTAINILNQSKGFEGLTKQMADLIRGDTLSQLKILWNNISALAISIGYVLAPAVQVLANGIRYLVGGFMDASPAVRSLTVMLAGLYLVGLTPVINGVLALGRLLIGPFLIPFQLAGSAISLVAKTLASLWSVLVGVGSAFMWLGGVAWKTLTVIWDLSSGLVNQISKVLTSIWDGLKFIVDAGIKGLMKMAFSFISNMLIGALELILTAVTTIISSVFVLSGILAIASTAAIGLGSLFTAIGAGIVVAWEAIKDSISRGWQYIKANAVSAGNVIVGMWDEAKDGAMGFFNSVGVAFTRVAGFFWNFQHNVKVIFSFLGENWEEVIGEFGYGLAVFVENTTKDFMILAQFISTTVLTSLKSIWDSASAYTSPYFTWLKENWRNILSDLSTIFTTFLGNLMRNFITAFNFVGKSLPAIIVTSLSEGLPKSLQKLLLGTTLPLMMAVPSLEDTMSKMRGPLEGLPGLKTLTGDPRDPTNAMWNWRINQASQNAGKILEDAGKSIATSWKEMNDVLVSPVGGFGKFSALMGIMAKSLDLNIPGGLAGLGEALMKTIAPPVMGEEGGEMHTKQSAGMVFKQISAARYELGGELASSLDYQQLVAINSIQKDVAVIRAATEKAQQGELKDTFKPWNSIWGE